MAQAKRWHAARVVFTDQCTESCVLEELDAALDTARRDLAARVENLAVRSTEGVLSAGEHREFSEIVRLNDMLSLLRLGSAGGLDDATLFRMAGVTTGVEQRTRLEALHFQQQRHGLSPAEQREEQALTGLYLVTILVRAQAALLLKQRGHDVTDPVRFHGSSE